MLALEREFYPTFQIWRRMWEIWSHFLYFENAPKFEPLRKNFVPLEPDSHPIRIKKNQVCLQKFKSPEFKSSLIIKKQIN